MDKKFWGILGGLIVIAIILVVVFSGGSGGSNTNAQPTNNIEGKGSTGVKLVEYGDFQCPACGEFYPTVEQVYQKYQNLITFQFRNFPLTSLHPNALAAARAGEAAALQGQFWPFYNKLYQENDAYYQSNETLATWISASDPLPDFVSYAQALGLNVTQFKSDFASSKVNNIVQADMNAGNKLGIDGTPTFYLDGKQLNVQNLVDTKTQQPSLDAFSTQINAAIKQKTGQEPNPSELVTPSTSPSPTSTTPSNEPLQTKK